MRHELFHKGESSKHGPSNRLAGSPKGSSLGMSIETTRKIAQSVARAPTSRALSARRRPPERGRFPVHICPTLFANLALVGNRHIDRLPDNTIASLWRRRTKSSRPNIYERAASTTLDETEWPRPLKFPSIHGPRPAGSGYLALWLLARRPFCYPNLYRPRRRNPDKAAHCPYWHPASP